MAWAVKENSAAGALGDNLPKMNSWDLQISHRGSRTQQPATCDWSDRSYPLRQLRPETVKAVLLRGSLPETAPDQRLADDASCDQCRSTEDRANESSLGSQWRDRWLVTPFLPEPYSRRSSSLHGYGCRTWIRRPRRTAMRPNPTSSAAHTTSGVIDVPVRGNGADADATDAEPPESPKEPPSAAVRPLGPLEEVLDAPGSVVDVRVAMEPSAIAVVVVVGAGSVVEVVLVLVDVDDVDVEVLEVEVLEVEVLEVEVLEVAAAHVKPAGFVEVGVVELTVIDAFQKRSSCVGPG